MSEEAQTTRQSTRVEHALPVDRRTLVKAAAWSTPAVTVAAVAPSVAASPDVIISSDVLVLSSSSAVVVCSNVLSVDVGATIMATNGAEMPVNTRMLYGIVPYWATTQQVENGDFPLSDSGGVDFEGVDVVHSDTNMTLEGDVVTDGQTNMMAAVFEAVIDLITFSSRQVSAADTQVVRKAFIFPIELPNPTDYTISNYDFGWWRNDGVARPEGSFDVTSGACNGALVEGTEVELTFDPSYWWVSETVDENGHVSYRVPRNGTGGTYPDGDETVTVTIGEWSQTFPISL